MKIEDMYITLQELVGKRNNSYKGQVVPINSIVGINVLYNLGYTLDNCITRKCQPEDFMNINLKPFIFDDKILAKNNIVRSILQLDNYMDNVEELYNITPFFYDTTKNFWIWDNTEYKYERVDETDLMNFIEDEFDLHGLTVSMKVKSNYIEAFKRVGRKHKPKDAPVKWIQFKNKAYSLNSGKIYDVTSDYFFTNPIPWELGSSDEIPIIEGLLKEWVGEEYKETLLEILAYCMYRDYPLHKIFCFIGSGSNGKGRFFALMRNLIGTTNCASVDLDNLIDNRFELAKVYKKLVCQMGETNFNTMSRTSKLKSLSGQDLVGFEFKGKDSIDDVNYSKILISTNTLPITTDQTDGFHRRWFNIRFPNKFKTSDDPLKKIPDIEYQNLCYVCVKKLKVLLDVNKFTNETDVETAKKQYNELSNPLEGFLKEHIEFGTEGHIFRFEFFEKFRTYLKKNGHREWSDREIGLFMKEKDVDVAKKDYDTAEGVKRYRAYLGINWLGQLGQLGQANPTLTPFMRNRVEMGGQAGQAGQNHEKMAKHIYDCTTLDKIKYNKNKIMTEHIYDKDSITQISSEDLLYFIEEAGEYDTIKFIEKYGQDKLDHLLQTGQVIEIKSGMLKVVD